MDLPQEVDDFIKHTIDHTLGLEIPTPSLLAKLKSLESTNHRLRSQYLDLLSKIKEKDDALDRARAEAGMNARAVRRFVEENQKLASECASLVSQCSRWEKECSLYDRDREALMEFANEADERAKEAEGKLRELEEEVGRVVEEARLYKEQLKNISVGSASGECTSVEQNLLDALIDSVVDKDEAAKTARAFLETNHVIETCNKMLSMWDDLRPGTQNILALVAQVQMLQNDKEHLRVNLSRAEDEVKLLFEENKVLDEENKRLLKQRNSARKQSDSEGKHSKRAATKSNKRKSCPKTMSSVEKIDFNNEDSPREPLSPLKENSPDSRMQKK